MLPMPKSAHERLLDRVFEINGKREIKHSNFFTCQELQVPYYLMDSQTSLGLADALTRIARSLTYFFEPTADNYCVSVKRVRDDQTVLVPFIGKLSIIKNPSYFVLAQYTRSGNIIYDTALALPYTSDIYRLYNKTKRKMLYQRADWRRFMSQEIDAATTVVETQEPILETTLQLLQTDRRDRNIRI